jgi:hypothetical protein
MISTLEEAFQPLPDNWTCRPASTFFGASTTGERSGSGAAIIAGGGRWAVVDGSARAVVLVLTLEAVTAPGASDGCEELEEAGGREAVEGAEEVEGAEGTEDAEATEEAEEAGV